MSGFKKFLMQGNVIDLAVAVVIGAAFTSVVNAFVTNLLNPLIAAIGGQPDLSALTFNIGAGEFKIGLFLNAVISFLLVAAVVYFLIVRPYTIFRDRRAALEEKTTRDCPECLTEIPIKARRCSHCCAEVGAAA
ncbi:large conductance mechanosensitive channel protein MscL [Nonomuraea sp. NPDC050310]|uniref:large conductance mechanosensitive channel protein MscL n=1 Tax=unclassified Nonomuraea TaxID=2593643 RepID=UPI0033DA83E3